MSVYDHEGFAHEPGEQTEPPLTPSTPTPTRRSLFTRRLTWRSALVIIFAVVALRLWVVESVIVEGSSMSSTLLPDEWVLVLKPLHPHRFSVVVFRDPEEGVPVIKRVVGLPGDDVGSVPINDLGPSYLPQTRLQVNGQTYAEPYARATGGIIPKDSVPQGFYYVLGDNRDDSVDSRYYGPVATTALSGVAVAVVYPLSRMRIISTTADPVPAPATEAAQ